MLLPLAPDAQVLINRGQGPDSSVRYARELYTAAVGSGAGLYNGFEYGEIELHSYDVGHPFYRFDDWATGTVDYDGQFYSGVSIMYDLVNNKVLIENPFNFLTTELINDKIQNFSVDGHHFVKLWGDSLAEFSVRPGFYDMLYDGTVKIFVHRKKEISVRLEQRVVIKRFLEINNYFIFKDGLYFPVRGRSSVIKVFRDQRAALRRLPEAKSMMFKRNRDLAMVWLAQLYDESRSRQ